MHFPHTGDDDVPQRITPVETPTAPLSDEGGVSRIPTEFAKKDLLPEQQLVASGDVTVTNLVSARAAAEVDLVGPTLKTHGSQAETGDDRTPFCMDGEAEQVTCPPGHVNSSWTPVQEAGKARITITCSQRDGKACPSQPVCPGTPRRSLPLDPRAQMGPVAGAAAVNLIRFPSVWRGDVPEQIRPSAFQRLMKQAA